jgi:hypothetical protein
MKRVNIKTGILRAIEETDEGLSRYPSQMMKWAKYIEREIGSKLGYKVKSKAIVVDGCYLDLPDDCYRVIGVFPGNHEDECNTQYRNIVSPIIQTDIREGADVYGRDLEYIWVPRNTTWLSELAYEEIGNQLHMIEDYDQYEMTLVYNYNEIDQNGNWIINESHVEAISKYIQYMYARKHRWKMFKSDKLLRQGHVATLKDLERDYNLAIRHARAEDASESSLEKSKY